MGLETAYSEWSYSGNKFANKSFCRGKDNGVRNFGFSENIIESVRSVLRVKGFAFYD